MGKKKKRKLLINRYVVLITSMLVLNIIGVGYGLWDNGIDLMASVFTGRLGVCFDENMPAMPGKNVGGLTVSYPDDRTILVSGTIVLGPKKVVTETDDAVITTAEYDEYEETLIFNIKNDGSIPAVLKNKKIINKNDELKLDLKAGPEIAADQTNIKSDHQLHIQAGEGEHFFEIELEFEQKQ